MRRRGIALVLVLSLAVLLLLAVGALFREGQDAVAQAARVEGRLALAGLLRNAAAEGWWLIANPGRFPAPPDAPAPEPIALYHALRGGGTGAATLPLRLTRGERAYRLPPGSTLTVSDVTVRGRDVIERDGVRQGTLELRATGEFRGDRVAVRLALVEVRPYWLASPRQAPRLDVGDAPVAQALEELP